MAVDFSVWWAAAQEWLCAKAAAHFSAWASSDKARKWRKNRSRSPYACGYSQPAWMDEMREAMGRGDEEAVKRIKLENL